MKVCILGGGSVALANAAFLSASGYLVSLWSELNDEREAWQETKKIEYTGYINGTAPVFASHDIRSCIDGAVAVIIAAPCYAHRALMSAASFHLRPEQFVILHPVTGLSSLILSKMLRDRSKAPTIVDLSTSLFVARRSSASAVKILRIKTMIETAAVPVSQTAQALKILIQLYGQRFRVERNILSISLNNHNPVYHVPPFLCNLSRAEKAENWIIWDNITPGIARLVELLDQERLAVARAYGMPEVSVEQYFRDAHDAEGADLYSVFQSVAVKLKGPIGPQTMDHRFILEDVPFGLVFFHALGEAAHVPMPLTEHMIGVTSALYDRDFARSGHTLSALGLDHMNTQEILQVAQLGFKGTPSLSSRRRLRHSIRRPHLD